MNAIFHKDVRLLRPVLWSAAAMAGLFWVVLPAVNYWQWTQEKGYIGHGRYDRYWGLPVSDQLTRMADSVTNGAAFMWLACLLLFAAVGGMAFALERRERWSDFTAMLPVPRRRLVWTKLWASVTVCGSIAAANWLVMFLATMWVSGVTPWNNKIVPGGPVAKVFAPAAALLCVAAATVWLTRRHSWIVRLVAAAFAVGVVGLVGSTLVATVFAAWSAGPSRQAFGWLWYESVQLASLYVPVALALFGVAWLLSAVLSSPVQATALAAGTVVAAYVWVFQTILVSTSSERPAYFALLPLEIGAALVGLLCIAAGVWVQRRRQSP